MHRFRDFRKDQATRDRHAEVRLAAADFIQPYFVVDGARVKREIPSLPGVFHFSTDRLLEDAAALRQTGVDKILLFGVIGEKEKDTCGTAAYREDNLVARTVAAVKEKLPDLTVMTDVCLCGYTSHGHCGLMRDGEVLNDESLEPLAQMALTHAWAGADFVAPSAMLDGQVAAIRGLLDANGRQRTRILAYSAKFASNFYGPFRGAAGSAPAGGDRKTYQMDFRTLGQATGEVAADLEEGADWVMVKPALPYLDIICRVKQQFSSRPLAAYQVSGEYMLLKAAAAGGHLEETQALLETLYAIKRAGADYIITYYARLAGELVSK